MKNPLDEAVRITGSQSALAEAFKIKPQAVQQWEFIPEKWALATERVTKGEVTARSVLEFAEHAKKRRAAA